MFLKVKHYNANVTIKQQAIMATFKSIEEFGKVFTKGSFGLYCATFTPKKLNKYPNDKGRKEAIASGDYNKYEGRVFTLDIYQNACSGVNYYACVKSECKREGIEFSDKSFEECFPYEKTYCDDESNELSNFVMKHETTDQKYLRLYVGRRPTHYKSVTFVDGHIATQNELKDIKRYKGKVTVSKKQEELGIKNIVGVRNVKVENVMFLVQGDKVWKNEDHFGSMIDLMTIIKKLPKFFK